jgi:uncharacterized OsmC-like protein
MIMSEKTMTRGPLNGVDVPTLFATVDAVRAQTELAKFRFNVRNRWQSGTHTTTSITSYYGAGGEHDHVREFTLDADHPQVLVGTDKGPLPVELLLAALASCLTGSIGNIAAARGVALHEVESRVSGEMDIRGILGLSDEVRNGYQKITVEFTIHGDASAEALRAIVEQSRARSAVFDIVTHGTAVELSVNGVRA